MSGGTLELSQFSDSSSYARLLAKMHLHSPTEVILPDTLCHKRKSRLPEVISRYLPDVPIVAVPRARFGEKAGMEAVLTHCIPERRVGLEYEIQGKYYCLAAAAAVFQYAEEAQMTIYAKSSVKVTFAGSEKTTMIDTATVKNLELLQNSRNPKNTRHSLYGVLDHTKTRTGGRLLRSELLQPPCDVDTITVRQEAVAALIEAPETLGHLVNVLQKIDAVGDVERLIASLILDPKSSGVDIADERMRSILRLKAILELVVPLRAELLTLGSDSENKSTRTSVDAIDSPTSTLLQAHTDALCDDRFGALLDTLKSVLEPDAHVEKNALQMDLQKILAVRTGVNGMLDVARRAFSETQSDVMDIVEQLAAKHDLPLEPGHSKTRGYYLVLRKRVSRDQLSETFTQVVRSRSGWTFTTPDLRRLNDRIRELRKDILLMSEQAIMELVYKTRAQVGCLYKLAEVVAMTDMLCAFAAAAVGSPAPMCRPRFGQTMALSRAYHPVLLALYSTKSHIEPNDIYMGADANFIVLTGPNMSGKSVHLRQVALLQVMAQVGACVPATRAHFRVADQLFSRISSDDRIETNSSTFALECQEMNFIIQSVTDNSLVIIDELGRGTGTQEGTGLCFAVCEYLIATGAFTIFATHFLELTSLDMYPNVENYHMSVNRTTSLVANATDAAAAMPEGADTPTARAFATTAASSTRVSGYPHVKVYGPTTEKHYGIDLAAQSALPSSVVAEAKMLCARLDHEAQSRSHAASTASAGERATFKTAVKLIGAASMTRVSEASLRSYLKALRQSYLAVVRPDTAACSSGATGLGATYVDAATAASNNPAASPH